MDWLPFVLLGAVLLILAAIVLYATQRPRR
jgi:hypothetical protein